MQGYLRSSILLCLLLVSQGLAENILPPVLQALDTPAAFEHTKYHRTTPEVRKNPDQYFRIVGQQAYRGEGCLQLTTYGHNQSIMIFRGPTGNYKAGDRYVASAYVRSEVPVQVAIMVWTDDGEDQPIDQLRDFFEVGPEWRQIRCEGFLTKDAPRANVLIRVNAKDHDARHTLLIDEVKLEPGAVPSPSERDEKKVVAIEPDTSKADYVIPWMNRPPKIDGRIGKAEWSSALAFGEFTVNNKAMDTPPQKTRVWMGYDKENIYVSAWCEEANLDRLSNLSKVRDRPDWSDDRIEFFINVLGIPRMPSYYLSINAFGVTEDKAIGVGQWDPPLDLAVRREGDGWTVEFSMPISCVGKHEITGEIWRMNIGRHHRATYTVSSQLAKYEGSFHEPPRFLTAYMAPPKGAKNDLRIISLSRGEMTPFGSIAGTNRATYRIHNQTRSKQSITFTANSMVGGKTVHNQTRSITVDPGVTSFEQAYELDGRAGEVLTFQANLSDENGPVLFRSENHVDLLQRFRKIQARTDGLFEPLLDKSAKRDPRYTGHLSWEQPISGKEYYSALQIGYEHSYDQILRESFEAKLHYFLHWIPQSPFIDKDWADRFRARQNPQFERVVRDARKYNGARPAFHTMYNVIGVDDEGHRGMVLAPGTGFLPDPINRRAFVDMARQAVRHFGDDLWAVSVGDEQTSRVLYGGLKWFANNPKDDNAPAYMLQVDRDVREKYGFGKYGAPWGISQTHKDYPLHRRAYISWILDQLRDINAELASAVHEIKPDMLIISEDTHGGGEISAETWRDYCTIGTLQLQYHRQHTYSYGTKRARDLSGLDHIIPVPHDCDAGFPHGQWQMDELRELYSQIFRGGGTGFHFWPASFGSKEPAPPRTASTRSGHRPAWEYLLKLSMLVNQMPPLKRPTDARAALFVSRESHKAGGYSQNRLEHLYALLGPESGGWFEFVSDTQLKLGHKELDDYSVVYISEAAYADTQTIDRLGAYCRAGGILVCADPTVFEHNINGESLAKARQELFGVETIELLTDVKTVQHGKQALPLNLELEGAQRVRVTGSKALVVATFDNGAPAIIKQRLGKGSTLYFAWSPLNRIGMKHDGWQNLIKQTYADAGGQFNHDIWRFMFPSLGVDMRRPQTAGRCLTGNYAFFYQHRMVEGRRQNVDGAGHYTILAGGELNRHRLGEGKLTDRLRMMREPHLAIGSRGYHAYLQFKPTDYVETFETGVGDVQIICEFEQPQAVERIVMFYTGNLAQMTVEAESANGQWRELSRAGADPTGFREVAAVRMKIDQPTQTRRLRLTCKRSESEQSPLSLVEMEIWTPSESK